MVDYFEQHPEIDVIFGDAILTDPSLQPLSYRRVILPRRWHTLVRPLGVLTCTTFFRRKLVKEGTLFDPKWKIIGDKAWVLSFFDRGYRMAVLHEPLAVFALTGSNLSNHQGVKAEQLRWTAGVPPMIRLVKPWVQGWHLIEKWKQGAYVRRTVDSAWYTWDSFPVRKAFTGSTLGWNWPVLTSKTS